MKVHSHEGEPRTSTANLHDGERKINEHVKSQTKIPVQDQVLPQDSETLKLQRKLPFNCIDKDGIIYLPLKVVSPSDEEMPLCLEESGDEEERHHLPVRRSRSVLKEKNTIETETVVTPKKQIVTCNGKRLEDGKLMGDYNIRRGHSLFLTYHCIGG